MEEHTNEEEQLKEMLDYCKSPAFKGPKECADELKAYAEGMKGEEPFPPDYAGANPWVGSKSGGGGGGGCSIL